MERDVRNYIIRILLAHLAALLLVVGVVAYAGSELYGAAREQAAATALEQASRPATSSADGISRHLTRVFDTLSLAAVAADESVGTGLGPPPLADADLGVGVDPATSQPSFDAAVWAQLSDAASDLLVVRVPEQGLPVVVDHLFNKLPEAPTVGDNANDPASNPAGEAESPAARMPELAGILRPQADRELNGPIAAAVREAAMNPGWRVLAGPMRLDEADGKAAAVAAVRIGGSDAAELGETEARRDVRALVAIVPAAYLDRSFLALNRQPNRLDLTLVDPNGEPLLDKPLDWPPELRRFVRARLDGRSIPTPLIDAEATIGGQTFDGLLPAVEVVLGTTEALPVVGQAELQAEGEPGAVASAGDEAGDAQDAQDAAADDEAPAQASRRVTAGVAAVLNAGSVLGSLETVSSTSTLWAGMLIIAVSAILVSSSVQLIRGRNRLERLRSEVVEKELSAAREIQLRWLPGREGKVGERAMDVAAENLPASHISGDFYNFFDLPGKDGQGSQRVALVVGDVTGHGMAAAFLMSTAQLLVESALKRLGDPGKALTEVNALLARQAHGGQFVTLIVAIVDVDAGEMLLAGAGHPGPLRCDGIGRWHDTEIEADLVAGVMDDVEYQTTRVPLGDTRALLFYTDGAVEAQDAAGDRFNLRRLAEGLRSEVPGGPDDARELVDAGLRVVRGFAGGVVFDDDVTFLAAVLHPAGEDVPTNDEASDDASARERDRELVEA